MGFRDGSWAPLVPGFGRTMVAATVVLLCAPPLFASPNAALVPPGASFEIAKFATPSVPSPDREDACESLGDCGSICPNPNSVFIADMAFDEASGDFVVIDVPEGNDGIFRMDARGCAIGPESHYAPVSQRACAIDNDTGIIYTATFVFPDHQTVWRLDRDFNVLGSQQLEDASVFMSAAVDEANRTLYLLSTNFTRDDHLAACAIQPDGSVVETGRSWMVEWQTGGPDSNGGSLEYDDCSGTFIVVNISSGWVEYFQLVDDELVGVGACPLPVGFAWGLALNTHTREFTVVEEVAFACDFPVIQVAPDPIICGAGGGDGLDLRLSGYESSYAPGDPFQLSIAVRNPGSEPAGLTRGVFWAKSAPPVSFTDVLYDGSLYEIGPETTLTYPYDLTIPGRAPLGAYTAGVSIFEGETLLDEESFEFDMITGTSREPAAAPLP